MRIHNDPATTSLGALVQAAGEGNETAWRAIVDRFAGLVWAVARAHRLSASDAADVSQTTWLLLVENLDRISDPDRLGAWLATTARRECLRTIRRGGRELATDEASVFDRLRDDPVVGQLIKRERYRALASALHSIDERCQTLLRLLAAVDPPSYEEIGSALGMPIGAIGPTRARCLDKLRRSPALAGMEPR